MKKKTVAASIMTLVCSASLVTGATFALFTSESSNNIAITSGKVEVVATIENMSTYSPKWIAADGTVKDDTNIAGEGVFSNGGTASLAEDGATLTLDKMVPGDRVDFDIVLTNESNVAIQYRTIVSVANDNGLVEALDIKVGVPFEDGVLYSKWEPMSTAVTTTTLDCYVELPSTAGNAYQNKTCEIVFTVEAVQGNTATDDVVAKVNGVGYDSLEKAIENVAANGTVEIVRPGMYAPFKIDKEGVTVKGINTGVKATSTVIKNTASKNIQAYANDLTFDSLYIESVAQTASNFAGYINYVHQGAIDPYISTDSGIVASNLTINNCRLVGCEGIEQALMFCAEGLTFTGNYVENFTNGVRAHDDNDAMGGWLISGNTFDGVEMLVDGYWGGKAGYDYDSKTKTWVESAAHDGILTITDNEVVGTDPAYIGVWDYAQNSNDFSAFSKITLSGNASNVQYLLTHFNYKAATAHTVDNVANVVYLSKIGSNIPFADKANYKIVNADGSALTNKQGYDTFTQNIGGNAGIYTLATGEYKLVEIKTGNSNPFTVVNPTVGVQQKAEWPVVETVGTAADLKEILDKALSGTDDAIISLSNTIDVDGKWETYIPTAGVKNVTINGNGFQIKNLNQPLIAGSFGGDGKVIFNNLTIEKAVITDETYIGNWGGIGAFVAYADACGGVEFNECKLTNSTIESIAVYNNEENEYDWGYAGGFIGYASASVKAVDCIIEKCNITGFGSTGAVIGHNNNDLTISNVTVSECNLHVTEEKKSWRVGALVGTMVGNVVVSGEIVLYKNSYTQNNSTGNAENELYGRNALAKNEDSGVVNTFVNKANVSSTSKETV